MQHVHNRTDQVISRQEIQSDEDANDHRTSLDEAKGSKHEVLMQKDERNDGTQSNKHLQQGGLDGMIVINMAQLVQYDSNTFFIGATIVQPLVFTWKLKALKILMFT